MKKPKFNSIFNYAILAFLIAQIGYALAGTGDQQNTRILIIKSLFFDFPIMEITSLDEARIAQSSYLTEGIYLDSALSHEREQILKNFSREFQPTVLSSDEAEHLFHQIQNPTDPLLKIIDWTVKTGGCNHRVRQLSRWLRTQNIRHEDVVIYGAGSELQVKAEPTISWPFHNAILLTVADQKGQPQKMVVDLALHPQGLIHLDAWLELMESQKPSQGRFILHQPHGGVNEPLPHEEMVHIKPAIFDPFWDESVGIAGDRKDCIDQDEPKLQKIK